MLLLLLSHFSRVRLCATPQTAAHQAPPPLGFSRQEHWSGLPFSSPIHESEKWKWSRSVVSDSWRPHGLQPTRLLHPWDFPGKNPGVGCHCLLRIKWLGTIKMAFDSTILLKVYSLYQIPNAWDIGDHCTPCVTNLVFNLGKDSIIIQKSTSGVYQYSTYYQCRGL